MFQVEKKIAKLISFTSFPKGYKRIVGDDRVELVALTRGIA